MKAALFCGRKDVRIEDVPEPAPSGGQVKIKVRWSGICGTDVHEYRSLGAPPTKAQTPGGSQSPTTGKRPHRDLREQIGRVVSRSVKSSGAGDPWAPFRTSSTCTAFSPKPSSHQVTSLEGGPYGWFAPACEG